MAEETAAELEQRAQASRAKSGIQPESRLPPPPFPPHSEVKVTAAETDTLPPKEPPKETPKEHYRVKNIPADRLASTHFSQEVDMLPMGLQAAAHCLYQRTKTIFSSPEEFELEWSNRSGRSFKSLEELASDYGVSMQFQSFKIDPGSATYSARMRMSTAKEGRLFELDMRAPRVDDRSTSFERKFGHHRFMPVDIPDTNKKKLHPDLKGQSEYIRKRLLDMFMVDQPFLGRKWAAFLLKKKDRDRRESLDSDQEESSSFQVWFFAVSGPGMKTIDIAEVVKWAVPFAMNGNQPARKAYARLDLAASRTIPTICSDPRQIFYDEEDQMSTPGAPDDETHNEDPNAPCRSSKRKEMSDGCATISVGVMKKIQEILDLPYLPTVVQGRIGGAKGLWFLSPGNLQDAFPSDDIWIKIRKSQIKEKHDRSDFDDDEELRTLNLVDFSRPAKSSSLHIGFLPILRDRGVPAGVILNVARAQIEMDTQKFVDSLEKVPDLHALIFKYGTISGIRRAKRGIPTVGGFPTASNDRALMMLEHGFEPKKCQFLKDEIMAVAELVFSLKAKQFRMRLPQSTYVFGICDPTGLLKPGEAHFVPSKPIEDEQTGEQVSPTLHGIDAVVSRNPSRRNSDIQRIRLVYRPELAHLKNVIVFSAQGPRSLASKLSGGDYDGDKFWICWDEKLVQPFRNAPAPWEAEPEDMDKYLEGFGIVKDSERLADVLSEPNGVRKWLRKSMEARMGTDWVGIVSNLHVSHTHHSGSISDETAQWLVTWHDLLLDADKQGYSMTRAAFFAMKQLNGILWNLPTPWHFKFTNKRQTGEMVWVDCGVEYKEQDILDALFRTVVEPDIKQGLQKARDVMKGANAIDSDLCSLFDSWKGSPLSIKREQASFLKAAVEALRKQWRLNGRQYHDQKQRTEGKRTPVWSVGVRQCRKSFKQTLPIDGENGLAACLVSEWTERIGNEPTTWEKLKLSALARNHVNHVKDGGRFMFSIMGKELCWLKSLYLDQARVVRLDILANMKPPKVTFEVDAHTGEDESEDDDDDDSDSEFGGRENWFNGIDGYKSPEKPPPPCSPKKKRKPDEPGDSNPRPRRNSRRSEGSPDQATSTRVAGTDSPRHQGSGAHARPTRNPLSDSSRGKKTRTKDTPVEKRDAPPPSSYDAEEALGVAREGKLTEPPFWLAP
jgi:hypothetical protein